MGPRKRAKKSRTEQVRPRITAEEIKDPTAVRDRDAPLDQDVVQLDSPAFNAQRITVRLPETLVIYHHTEERVRSITRLDDGLMAFTVVGEKSSATVNGKALNSDLMLVATPGAEGELVVEAGYESVVLLMSPRYFEGHLQVRERASEFSVPDESEIFAPDAATARRLFELGKRLTDTAARKPEYFARNELARVVSQLELLEALLDALAAFRDLKLTRQDRTRQAQSRIVRTVEDYVLSNPDEQLSVTDLCKVAAASERTLQYAFQEIMEITPMAYLKRLRLHRVREALRESGNPSTRNSSVALAWGFWHFGEFARDYRDCFGELPSQTLKGRR